MGQKGGITIIALTSPEITMQILAYLYRMMKTHSLPPGILYAKIFWSCQFVAMIVVAGYPHLRAGTGPDPAPS
ncbi:MAG: hypothetical protein U9R04_00010 [Chloroflexota bacterium]|nr:hypothetical protein [Chloroflexota bacterium]